MRRTKQIDVRRALALAGTFSFVCCCARACLLPFLTLYLRRLGLTPAMTGAAVGAQRLIALLWTPAASALAKHYDKRRAVIYGSLASSAALALLLLLLPSAGVQTDAGACNVSEVEAAPTQSSDLLVVGAGTERPSTRTTPKQLRSQAAITSNDTRSDPGVSGNRSTFTAQNSSVTLNNSLVESKTNSSVQFNISSPVRNNRSESKEETGSSFVESKTNSSVQFNISSPVRNKRSESESQEETGSSFVESNTNSSVQFNISSQVRNKRSESTEETGSSFAFLDSLKVMDVQHQLFVLVLLILSLWEFTSAPLDWTVEDGLYEYLDFADASDRRGSADAWGLLGAACGVGGSGLLVSRLGCPSMTRGGAVHFLSHAALAALALPVAACLPLHLSRKRERGAGLLKAARLVRGSPRALLCAATALLAGAARSAADDFLLWEMQDRGSGELHMGVALALAVLSQAAFPLLARRLTRLLGAGRLLALGAGSLALQCLYYSFLWGPWAPLPAQLLSCLSGGALRWAVRVQCEELAAPGAERSVGRVYSSLHRHLGAGLGSLAGGLVAQRFGVPWLFRGAAAMLAAWCVCLPLLQCRTPQRRRINYSRLLAADASEASDSESERDKDWLDEAMEDDRSSSSRGRRWNQ